MRICNSCGGIVGRDCFNPVECQYITDSINAQNEQQASRVPDLEMDLNTAHNHLNALQSKVDRLKAENQCLKEEKARFRLALIAICWMNQSDPNFPASVNNVIKEALQQEGGDSCAK